MIAEASEAPGDAGLDPAIGEGVPAVELRDPGTTPKLSKQLVVPYRNQFTVIVHLYRRVDRADLNALRLLDTVPTDIGNKAVRWAPTWCYWVSLEAYLVLAVLECTI